MKSKQQLSEEWDLLVKAAPKLWSIWKHSKSEGVYEVVGYSFLESTLEFMVMYQCIKTFLVFSRPMSEWEEPVVVIGGEVPRFIPWKEEKTS